MTFEFSSRLTRGGNIITPQIIVVSENGVTWKKRNKWLIGVDMMTIPRNQISSIEIDNRIWGTTITINAVGNSKIIGKNFSIADAKKIKELLEKKIEP